MSENEKSSDKVLEQTDTLNKNKLLTPDGIHPTVEKDSKGKVDLISSKNSIAVQMSHVLDTLHLEKSCVLTFCESENPGNYGQFRWQLLKRAVTIIGLKNIRENSWNFPVRVLQGQSMSIRWVVCQNGESEHNLGSVVEVVVIIDPIHLLCSPLQPRYMYVE